MICSVAISEKLSFGFALKHLGASNPENNPESNTKRCCALKKAKFIPNS